MSEGGATRRSAQAAVLALGALMVTTMWTGAGAVLPDAGGGVGTGPAAPGFDRAVRTAQACDAGHRAPPTVALPPAEVDATLRALHGLYADLPDFVDVYFYPGLDEGGPAFFPTFVGAVPDAARTVETPVPVAFDVLPAEPRTVRSVASAPAGPVEVATGPGPLPDAGDVECLGIRPGAHMTGGCTASFVFTDGTDIYVGTAGHCVREGETVSSPAAGFVGTAVFSTGGDSHVGHDFALIKVDPEKHHLVSAEMCDWAGPTGGFNESSLLGRGVVHTGHGAVGGLFGPHPPRPRAGTGVGWGLTTFTFVSPSVPGDSGSAVRETTSGHALGTLTHLYVSFLIPSTTAGTRWDHGLDLAAEEGITGLELMTVDYVHPV